MTAATATLGRRAEGIAWDGLGYRLAAASVVVQLVLSATLLAILGVNYNLPGGSPLVKFHPGTYLVAASAACLAASQGGLRAATARLAWHAPSYLVLCGAMALCAVMSILGSGVSGVSLFVENYIAAGLLGYALEALTRRQRQTIGRLMLLLCAVSAVIALGESATHAYLIAPRLGELPDNVPGEFRGVGLFDHPLSGAFMTMLAMLLLPGARLAAGLKAAGMALFAVAMLGYGGRTALVTALGALGAMAALAILRGAVMRRLSLGTVAATLAVLLLGPAAAYLLLTHTPIGERLVAHSYYDSSAEVRAVMWRVLDHLSLREALFGLPEGDYPDLVFAWIGVDPPGNDIENPWLLTFLKTGAVGFVVYLLGLAPFLLRLWRCSALWGRIILVCGLFVISSNNSIGHKCNYLVMLTAFAACSAGFDPSRGQRRPSATTSRRGTPAMSTALATPPRGSTMRLLMATVRQDWPRMATAAALTVVVALVAAVLSRPLYHASSTLLVQLSTEYTYRPAAGESINVAGALDREQILRTEVEILQNPDLHRQVIREVGIERLYPRLLDRPGPVNRFKQGVEAMIAGLRRSAGGQSPAAPKIDPVDLALPLLDDHLAISASRTGNIVELAFDHPDNVVSAEVLARLEAGFFAKRRDLYLNQESALVSEQASGLRDKLEAADAALAQFKADHDIGNFHVRRDILLNQQGSLETELRAAASDIAQDSARLSKAQKVVGRLKPEILQSRDADVDARLSPLRGNVEAVRARLQDLRTRYTEDSQAVGNAKRELDALEAALGKSRSDRSAGAYRMAANPVRLAAEQDFAKVQIDLEAARARRDAAQEGLDGVRAQLATLNGAEMQLTQLERARALQDEDYRAAAKIRDERLVSESVQAARQPSVRVLQPPVIPALPRATRMLILEAGILLGLVGSLAIGLASHLFRRGYLVPEALEYDTGLPVLASVSMHGPASLRHPLGQAGA